MKYRVIVTRDTTESIFVTVEADNPLDADEKALDIVQNANVHVQNTFNWELDDGAGKPYIGAPGDAEPLEVTPDAFSLVGLAVQSLADGDREQTMTHLIKARDLLRVEGTA